MTTNRNALLGSFTVALSVASVACAYRLPPPMLPSVYKVKVVAGSPERYTLRLRLSDSHEYEVPPDGRVTIAAPAYRAECSVYLFDKLRIRKGANPFTEKRVVMADGAQVVRQFSLKEIASLPLDGSQYHILVPRRQ